MGGYRAGATASNVIASINGDYTLFILGQKKLFCNFLRVDVSAETR
jgi:hypothetical protein